MTPTVSVIICTYTRGRWTYLVRAIDGVRAQLSPGDDLVVVIDHAEALLTEVREHWAFDPRVAVVANTGAQGLSGARNTGVANTLGDVLLFLDDDATPGSGWLESYRARFADQRVAAVGGSVRPEWDGGVAPRWFPDEYGWVVGCDYAGLPGDGAPLRNPIGASMAIRRDAFTKVSGFSERVGRVGTLPVGCEETEFCIRLRQADPDAVILRDTSAVVSHSVPESRKRVRYFMSRCYHEGRSKAMLTELVGSSDGLSAERSYVLKSLTRGMGRHLAAAPRGDVGGIARAGMIPVGLAVTTTGYASGTLSQRRAKRAARRAPAALSAPATTSATTPATSPARVAAPGADWPGPMAVLDYHVDPGPHRLDPPGPQYTRVRLLVFRAGRPRGFVDVPRLGLLDDADALHSLANAVVGPDGVIADFARIRDDATVPRATVVVPTKGRAGSLRRCVTSLLAQDHPEFEVLVVDNNASDESTRDVLGDLLADSRLQVVSQPTGGSSEARNRGIELARHPVVAQTDDDVIADPGWLRALVSPFDDPTVSAVTGLVVPIAFDTWAQELFEEYGGFGKGFDARRYDLDEHRGDGALYPYTAGTFGSGNNLAYRVGDVRELGCFDPLLGPGSIVGAGQDLDLFLKFIFSGRTIVYQPASIVRHQHRDTLEGLERQLRSYGRGLAAIMAKWAMSDPRRLFGIGWRLPQAAIYLLSPTSGKNEARGSDYPPQLRRAELTGLTQGLTTYTRARLHLIGR